MTRNTDEDKIISLQLKQYVQTENRSGGSIMHKHISNWGSCQVEGIMKKIAYVKIFK